MYKKKILFLFTKITKIKSMYLRRQLALGMEECQGIDRNNKRKRCNGKL